MTLILASGSPRRRELLARLNIPFQTAPSEFTERGPRPGESPTELALALARQKARRAMPAGSSAIVLGSDTVVALDGQMLGKPRDRDDALRMLRMLRDRRHVVVTAVAVRCGGVEYGETEEAEVCMRDYSEAEMKGYVATGEPDDKAGAYAVQDRGGELVASVLGCYETVVGLPLCVVQRLLERCGVRDVEVRPTLCTHFMPE